MSSLFKAGVRHAVCVTVSLSMLLQPLVGAAAQLNLVKTPLFVSPPIPPLVMLDVSKDQQLHKKAYNDYSDLDNDGKLETTYKHSIDYYGYFDSYKCYDYVNAGTALATEGHFVPAAWTADKYCTNKWSGNFLNWATMTRLDSVRKLLFGGYRRADKDPAAGGWTYGSTALLERSHLPTDAHAFAKYYGGNNLTRLTPFNLALDPVETGDISTGSVNTAAVTVVVQKSEPRVFTDIPATFADGLSPGDQIRATARDVVDRNTGKRCVISGRLVHKSTATTPTITLWVDVGGSFVDIDYNTDPPTPGAANAGATPALNCSLADDSTTSTRWRFENLSSTGITICNMTPGSNAGDNRYSHSNTNTPRLRVIKGNHELWASNERLQCGWRDENANLQGGFFNDDAQKQTSNGNQFSQSGLASSADNPSRTNGSTFATLGGVAGGTIENRALGTSDIGAGEYSVLVAACHKDFWPAPTGYKTTERCKSYGQLDASMNPYYKPIGLLQVYGDDGRINFGLMTGSYSKNTSGGVLRKNPGALTDEVASATGIFTASPLNGSIIGTLSRLRMYGYDYNDGTYIGVDGNCKYQLTSADLTDGRCRTWGNPMSEIYAESLRYFAGATTPTTAFNTDDSTLFPAVGTRAKLTTAAWPNPNNVLTNNNYCAPLNILVFNASVSSKDSDLVATMGDPFNGAIPAWASAKTATTFVGNQEGLNSGSYFVGNVDSSTPGNGLCDAKPAGGGGIALGNVEGLCPEAPSLNGSYLIAGLAYAARTNRIRTDLTVPSDDKKSLKVATYGISLATNVPRIEIPVPGSSTGQKVVIQPVYRLDLGGGRIGAGAIVDVKIVFQSADGTSGRMYVNWEDSEQGGDYDQDVWGVIDYRFSGANLLVTTNVVAASTANGQGFGYVISGTTKDGPHFHSGIYGFSFTDPASPPITNDAGTALNGVGFINASGGCQGCTAGDVPTTATYTISSAGAGKSLQDPLWYAGKYGGFTEDGTGGTISTSVPNLASEWDNINNATGAAGSDGIPDNFYSVSNPLGLEAALDKLFISILQTSAASAVAANSSKLNTSTRIYQAVFNPSFWSGQLKAFGVNATTGVPTTDPIWDGSDISLASTKVTPSARSILTFNKGVATGNPQGIKFLWPSNPASPLNTELSPAQIAALNTNPDSGSTDSAGSDRLNYLRGDGAKEGLSTTNYRRRPTTKLGDIINSNPVFVGPPTAGYSDASYRTFAATNINRTPMLYVGANDGMLHGFDASLSGTPGTELLAYVPSSVYRNLSKLTSRTYSHEYFVDGSPIVEDAFVGSVWKTVLVGGLNRGGQGIYALDVTTPSGFLTNSGSVVMWEFTDADDPDLGYTFGTPVIRKMSNGKWAAIVSGGYNNSQGTSQDPKEVPCAGLTGPATAPYEPAGCTTGLTGLGYVFIIYLDGPTGTNGKWQLGTDYFKLSSTTGNVGTPNGMGSPFAADINGDGAVDRIYSGDLLGGLWRFDVSGAATTWMDSSKRLKLFDAVDASGNPQPITSGVEAVLHPSGNGVMVSFGTGKYLETTDVRASGTGYQTQSIYGIWDLGSTVPSTNLRVIPGTDGVLMPQLLQPDILNIRTINGAVTRITTRHQPNYTIATRSNAKWDGSASLADKLESASTKLSDLADQRGWFLDLFNGNSPDPVTGERIIYSPFVKNGVVFYSSLWPSSDVCRGSTAGDNITLMIATGARPDASVFDLDGDQQVNASDMVTVGTDASGKALTVAVSSRRIEGGSAQPPTLVSKGSVDIGYQNTTSGNLATGVYSFGRGPGRVSWREILY